jgi:hypothetical protein
MHRHQTSRTIQIIAIRMITPNQVMNASTSISVGPDWSGYGTCSRSYSCSYRTCHDSSGYATGSRTCYGLLRVGTACDCEQQTDCRERKHSHRQFPLAATVSTRC